VDPPGRTLSDTTVFIGILLGGSDVMQAMAQTNPANSRAIAVTTTERGAIEVLLDSVVLLSGMPKSPRRWHMKAFHPHGLTAPAALPGLPDATDHSLSHVVQQGFCERY
jgi:hypothetical protein